MSGGAPEVIHADVVVFGAGIAGLTAAHELAERNFRVTVIDPDLREGNFYGTTPDDDNPGLGGMARTQWCYLYNRADKPHPVQKPVPPSQTTPTRTRPFRAFRLDWHLTEAIEAAIDLDSQETIDLPLTISRVRTELEDRSLRVTIKTTPRLLEPDELDHLRGVFAQQLDRMVADPKLRALVLARFPATPARYAADALTEWGTIEKLLAGVLTGEQLEELFAFYDDEFQTFVVLRQLLAGANPALQQRCEHVAVPASAALAGTATVEANVFALPGEHGFRFFPSFYRHVFDTMRRTPLMKPRSRKGGFSRAERGTVLDNLVPAEHLVLAGDSEEPSIRILRRQGFSPEKLRALLQALVHEARYTESDLIRLTGKLLQYLTSSRRRRETEYENQSWYDFVEADRLSPVGQRLTEMIPGVLVGLQSSEADARTQGTIALQCLLDQFGDGTTSDRLLNGPADNAWFGHWHRFLCSQDVTFRRGKLTGFSRCENTVVPTVFMTDREATFKPIHLEQVLFVIALPLASINRPSPDDGKPEDIPGALQLAEAFVPLAKACGKPARDFAELVTFAGSSSSDLTRDLQQATPRGPLRHLSGIQYYFAQELRLWRSHTQYLDAPAGLTAIAQPQFWLDLRNILTGYRSVLSVDIGTWKRPERNGRPIPGTSPHDRDYPWQKSHKDIADLVWRQIGKAHEGDVAQMGTPLPVPVAYHVDDNLVLHKTGDGDPIVVGNRSPYLVNLTRRFRQRPGLERAASEDPEWRIKIGYEVAADQYVLAGTHMQTFTRITSMESACESGRHAVNALLRKLEIPGELCGIWDPEDHEPDLFDLAKALDHRLSSQRARHAGEHLTTLDEWHVVIDARRKER